jgi:hypothetical protein
MRSQNCVVFILLLTAIATCKKDNVHPDPCSELVNGYIIGFSQCAIGKGFVLAIINPPDTIETFNLPDSIYNLSKNIKDPLYANWLYDYRFPQAYREKFPIQVSFEAVSEANRHHSICLDQYTAHYSHDVKVEVKIRCVKKD